LTGLVREPPRGRGPWIAAILASMVAMLAAQSVSVHTAGGVVRVRAPAFEFIGGRVMDRLRDGRSVEIELVLTAFDRAGGRAIAETRQAFTLSFDLWEERVAVTRVGKPPRSVSHLRPTEAQAWCLEHLPLPAVDLARRGREVPFWIRLESRIQDGVPREMEGQSAFTLRGLIDALSQRGQVDELNRSLEAGPFRLTP
jgi:hypothetical protein